jgi:hypothetical protein
MNQTLPPMRQSPIGVLHLPVPSGFKKYLNKSFKMLGELIKSLKTLVPSSYLFSGAVYSMRSQMQMVRVVEISKYISARDQCMAPIATTIKFTVHFSRVHLECAILAGALVGFFLLHTPLLLPPRRKPNSARAGMPMRRSCVDFHISFGGSQASVH